MNMQKMLKQAQKMQAEMAKTQEELKQKTVEVTAGGGVITVIANGSLEITDIKIQPDAVDPEDVDMLEDLVLAAVNEALRKAQDMAA
ncbi:MAG: YbaB/EbfC family nucleoid-associated protein, partial [Firmicutes bacterium]|nr:YbaB/EbfC family nucleoid-associated protein [Bacillota bacterium]